MQASARDVLAEAFQVLAIALGIQIISYLLGLLLYRKEENGRRMVLRYATICSNAGFMGNPVVEGIYGSQGLLYASVYPDPFKDLHVVRRTFLFYSGKPPKILLRN